MTLLRCYLQKDKVVIPTVARTTEGFYLDVTPVLVIDRKEQEELKQTLVDMLAHGNVEISTPDRADQPGSAILERLKIPAWKAFEKESVMYTIHFGFKGAVLYVTGRNKEGMWTQEDSFKQEFPDHMNDAAIVDAVLERFKLQSEIEWPQSPGILPPPKEGN